MLINTRTRVVTRYIFRQMFGPPPPPGAAVPRRISAFTSALLDRIGLLIETRSMRRYTASSSGQFPEFSPFQKRPVGPIDDDRSTSSSGFFVRVVSARETRETKRAGQARKRAKRVGTAYVLRDQLNFRREPDTAAHTARVNERRSYIR